MSQLSITTTEGSEAARKLIEGLTEDLKDEVTAIEAMPETTRNHYGQYMRVLSLVPGYEAFVAVALIKAGANVQGVRDALYIQKGG